jgi:two-component system NtrC family sensor kinase
VASVDHIARIVSGLKDFARQSNFESAPFDLNAVIHQTEIFLSHQLKRRRIGLDLELDPGLPTLTGDATQLQQVLTNLITNARDALESHPAPAIRISTRLARGGRIVVCRVRDNGPGIPAEVRRNIFRSFFTTKEAGKGTGLGLSISRGIVQNHGGRLGVHCPARGGSVFTLVLPVSRGGLQRDAPEAGGRNAA